MSEGDCFDRAFKLYRAKLSETALVSGKKQSVFDFWVEDGAYDSYNMSTENAITVENSIGILNYKKNNGNAKITVNSSSGNITLKKGLKKGTYKVKISVTDSGNTNYNSCTKEVTVRIKVK
ncbi:MAG: hypothetical protein K5656_02490 [Lachnospiraceae bacterium]|nr:hypothetical protein [Lachnospiraceae bacterium]